MFVVGLTGGIGSGKSTFAALLAEHGAQVVDADQLGRDALRPDGPAWHKVVSQFGEEILAAGSVEIDRKRLARVVFEDPNQLAALNAIVHPAIFKGIADSLDALRESDAIVVLDAALIYETGLDSSVDVTIVVATARERRSERLRRDRGLSPADINARMAAQTPQEQLVERADIVVRNDGSLEELAERAKTVWSDLVRRRDAQV